MGTVLGLVEGATAACLQSQEMERVLEKNSLQQRQNKN
jgi:hypothetical protein